MWRPIIWRARNTYVTRDVGAQACVKTLTMIFANVRAVFVRAFIIKSALLETGHVLRSQTVCLVSKRYSIRGCALNWFQSYLSNCLQQVEYRGNLSSPCHLSHGVPQGSTLGPLLFLIYVNDFQNCLQKGRSLNVCR